MEQKDRIKEAYEYLRYKGLVDKHEDVAEKMSRNRVNVSKALNGDPKYLTGGFTKAFCEVFNIFNVDYIISGEGKLLKDDISDSGLSPAVSAPSSGIPYYGNLLVSAGQYDLATVMQSEQPTGVIDIPGIPASIGAFPIIGCSMEPDIRDGDYVCIAPMDRFEAVDPEKTYLIITQDDRMIKHLAVDDENSEILWCISPNYQKFQIRKSEILAIFRVTFSGRRR